MPSSRSWIARGCTTIGPLDHPYGGRAPAPAGRGPEAGLAEPTSWHCFPSGLELVGSVTPASPGEGIRLRASARALL
ncbi:MAG: hypothetical protein M3R24_03400 [Chloroflexota bacterium]|nr:hypothetical protein [Chloroflexota bacterium]